MDTFSDAERLPAAGRKTADSGVCWMQVFATMSYTLTETGQVLTETQQGITMPADYSFVTVNDFVHGVEVSFEDLLALCLGMACEIDKLRSGNNTAPGVKTVPVSIRMTTIQRDKLRELGGGKWVRKCIDNGKEEA